MSGVPGDAEPLLTMREVADYLRVPYETFRFWRRYGKGPRGFRYGRGGVRFRWSDVQAWLEQQREAS